MNKKTKTQQAIEAFRNGSFKSAFHMMKNFSGFSKKELRTIQIAYECLSGKEQFYQTLGIDTKEMINEAIVCVSKRYQLHLKHCTNDNGKIYVIH